MIYLRPVIGRVGVMVSALDSSSSGPGSAPGRGHCVVSLDKTRSAQGIQMDTGKLNAEGNPLMD